MSLLVFAGLAGFAMYAFSFAMVQLGRMDGNGLTYTVCNMAAAALVLLSMFDQFNLGSLLTQLTWIGVGFVGVGRRVFNRPASASASASTSSSPASVAASA